MLQWDVISQAGQVGTVNIFLNFPVMDMNRNVLWRNPENVAVERLARNDKIWGDDSWNDAAYTTERSLFGERERNLTKTWPEPSGRGW
jgi:hypothetical protein